jgi:CRP-like cAMP-binding protein
MKEELSSVLNLFADFNEEELAEVLNCFNSKVVSKNEILLYEGKVCNEFYFVKSGCLRVYFTDRNGSEKTRYLMLDHHIGTALSSFISREPSFEFVEALDNSEILLIKHSDFYKLLETNVPWQKFYTRILEMAYSFQDKKIEQLVTLDARQRYEKVIEENPILIQKVSNRILASYLDIREETLSRLKSQ